MMNTWFEYKRGNEKAFIKTSKVVAVVEKDDGEGFEVYTDGDNSYCFSVNFNEGVDLLKMLGIDYE